VAFALVVHPTTFAVGWVKFFELIELPASIWLSGAGDDGVDHRQGEGLNSGTQRIKRIAASLRFLREHWPLDTQSASRSADLSAGLATFRATSFARTTNATNR